MKKDSQKNISTSMLTEIVQSLLGNLKERPKLILEKRFGLNGNEPMVLGKIGDELNVTRERIRQIESDSFNKLRSANKNQNFKLIEKQALEAVKAAGGFCEKRILKETIKKNVTLKQRNQMMFILNCSKSLKFKRSKLNMKGFWFATEDDKIDKEVVNGHNHIVKYIKDRKKPVSFPKILEQLRKDKDWKIFFSGKRGSKRLQMILQISQIIDKNILNEWGLKNWKVISQRGAREKAYIVLRKYKKPLHFRRITDLMNTHWDEKEALPQTVHNELIKDQRFVLIGRGIYGLRNWGYPEGTVKEVIISFLQNVDGPVEKSTIIEYVLTKKQVKKTTVMVTLADRKKFLKTNEGLFTIKQ